uniref:Uncharacterized protein n=1 Tax=Palpitomonas bilix TaxID=652834 RepID=A0A7S3DHB0_9EUKA
MSSFDIDDVKVPASLLSALKGEKGGGRGRNEGEEDESGRGRDERRAGEGEGREEARRSRKRQRHDDGSSAQMHTSRRSGGNRMHANRREVEEARSADKEMDSWELAWAMLKQEEVEKERKKRGGERGDAWLDRSTASTSMGENAVTSGGKIIRYPFTGTELESYLTPSLAHSLSPSLLSLPHISGGRGGGRERVVGNRSGFASLLPPSFHVFGTPRLLPSPPLSFRIHTDVVSAVAMTERRIASGQGDGSVLVWDFERSRSADVDGLLFSNTQLPILV